MAKSPKTNPMMLGFIDTASKFLTWVKAATTTPEGLRNNFQLNAAGEFYIAPQQCALVKMSAPPGVQQTLPAGTQITIFNPSAVIAVGVVEPIANRATKPALMYHDKDNGAVLMLAGYIYKFEAKVTGQFLTASDSFTTQFVMDEVTLGPGTKRQTAGNLVPAASNSLLGQNSIPNGTWEPTVDTWIRLAVVSNSTAGNKINTPTGANNTGCSWEIQFVGVQ